MPCLLICFNAFNTSWDQNWGDIRLEYSRKLLGMFLRLAGHPSHQLVFMRSWQIDPSYLLGAFRDFYEESPLNITRILMSRKTSR